MSSENLNIKNDQYTIIKKIGSGSYGDVYESQDSSKQKWAVKQIDHCNDGIPCLLEAVIMSSFIHPSINQSIKIFNTENKLNIIQRRAISDLSKRTQRQVNPINLVRKWLHMITEAIGFLHHNNLIHADIKAANVLYFSDEEVRLGDFTLTTKKWTNEDTFKHQACTYSHCPPEILRGEHWNDRIDIWSLGCLYYEVAFGELLFPHQPKIEDKLELRRRYYNAIAEWKVMALLGSHNHIPAKTHPCYNTPEYEQLRRLIDKMLTFDFRRRPCIKDILNDPFFDGMGRICTGEIRMVSSPQLNEEDEKRLEKSVSILLDPMNKKMNHDDIKLIELVACEIYRCSHELSSATKKGNIDLTLVTSCWIAGKLVTGEPPILATTISNNSIFKGELELCAYLDYCIPFMV